MTLGCACDVVASPRDSALLRVTELLCNVTLGFARDTHSKNAVTFP